MSPIYTFSFSGYLMKIILNGIEPDWAYIPDVITSSYRESISDGDLRTEEKRGKSCPKKVVKKESNTGQRWYPRNCKRTPHMII